MFKVGDRVKVVKAVSSSVEDSVGGHGVITSKGTIDTEYGQLYRVRLEDSKWWLFECELEHDKEHQVLEILRQWNSTRQSSR